MRNDFNYSPITNVINEGLRKYMTSVYNRMFFALCLTGIVSLACISNQALLSFMAGGSSIILMIATFGIVMYLSARIHKIDSEKASALFWIYSALIGALFSPIFLMYTGESIATSFFVAAGFFGGMSLYGYATKRDLTSVGSFMTVGLFAVIIASIVNIFLKNSVVQLGLSALCVVIFSGLTAYDVQKIKSYYVDSEDPEISRKKAILGSLTLYLDFINLFLALLRLLGNRRD